MNTRQIILIAHNLRSCHNVGSLFRTAEGLGVTKLYLTGYTPYPIAHSDTRLPHVATKIQKQIDKTALGADKNLSWQYSEDIFSIISNLKSNGDTVIALEQTVNSCDITAWLAPSKLAIVVGRETKGLEPEVIDVCDYAVEIPMLGKKESFNVVQAAAMAIFYCVFAK